MPSSAGGSRGRASRRRGPRQVTTGQPAVEPTLRARLPNLSACRCPGQPPLPPASAGRL